MTIIPSDEEFARAKQTMAAEARDLDIVEHNTKRRFMSSCSLHSIWVFPERDVDFRAHIFFTTERELDRCRASGVCLQISAYIRDQLELLGRGRKDETTVAFEFDSDENVQCRFGGDYSDRLR